MPSSTVYRRLAASALILSAALGHAAELRPDQATFRELYRELVETNTTLSAGSCTEAAEKMAARLRAAGMPAADVQVITVPEHPREGNLFAVLHGSDASARPMLLLAHIDVVEARREDWSRDPFTLVEEDGYFYARGAMDDKAMAAVWVDTFVRIRAGAYKPARTIKLALTCGEETNGAFNGAEYLSTKRRDLIDAAFALNEGAWGMLDEQGRRVAFAVQAGEKTTQNFRLEVRNPGGHSSRPVKDNAIYHLAGALLRIGEHEFPVQLNDVSRAYFERLGDIVGGAEGAAMKTLAANPADAKAAAIVTANTDRNAMLRTTCVATMLDGGHATNALPQRAGANVNCRVFPGVPIAEIQRELERVIADPAVAISVPEVRGPPAKVPPLTPAILGPIEQLAAKHYPGVPVLPLLQAGGTDGQFTGNAGIPTYGVMGMFIDADLGGIHGLNERIRVQSVYEGRDFLYELVQAFATSSASIP